MTRRVALGIAAIATLASTALFFAAVRPVTSRTPELMEMVALTDNGPRRLIEPSGSPTWLLFVHPDCRACRDQLQMLAEHPQWQDRARLFVLSDVPLPSVSGMMAQWPSLGDTTRVLWGVLPQSLLSLGIVATPTLLIADTEGRVIARVIGQMGVQGLLAHVGISDTLGGAASSVEVAGSACGVDAVQCQDSSLIH